jgi:hypothetical protein
LFGFGRKSKELAVFGDQGSAFVSSRNDKITFVLLDEFNSMLLDRLISIR